MTSRLSDMRGNAEARERLLSALGRSRLPHALLLEGPTGVGKTATALALARALLCPDADPDACGTCNTCRRAVEGLHPDLITIEPDGQYIKVDAARAMVRESFLRPYEGQAKVFLFPRADRFNDESANTILKTLEEPPDGTYLILVTPNRAAVLQTILSRCQSVAFHPLTRAELASRLIDEHEMDPEEAAVRARRAKGSTTAAVEIDLEALAVARAEAIDTLLPLAQGHLRPDDAERVVKLAASLTRKGGDLHGFLFDTVRVLTRDALVLAGGGDEAMLVSTDDLARARELAASLGVEGATALLADLDQAEEDLTVFNASKKLLVEAVLLGVYDRAAH